MYEDISTETYRVSTMRIIHNLAFIKLQPYGFLNE